MELRRLLHLLRQRLLLIIVLVAAALAAGYAVTPRGSVYKSTAILFAGLGVQPQSSLLYNFNLQSGEQALAESFAPMISQPTVVQGAIATAGLPRSAGQLSGETKATTTQGTNLIYLTVSDPDPLIAQRAANAIAQEFVNQIGKIDPIATNANGTGVLKSPVAVYQPALLSTVPVKSSLRTNLTLSGIFGLLVAVGLVLLLDYVDLSVRTADDLEKRSGLPVLGVIPFYPELAPSPIPAERLGTFVGRLRGSRA